MVILDGHIFQIDGGGVVREMPYTAHTPFACVTLYQLTCTEIFDGAWTWESFERALYSLLPSHNIFYALRIEGEFEQVNVRSIPRQDSYRPLVEVAREQALMEFHGVHGMRPRIWTRRSRTPISSRPGCEKAGTVPVYYREQPTRGTWQRVLFSP